jgi:multidrug efflux pump subunit AcrA (membrane-fusion protein)
METPEQRKESDLSAKVAAGPVGAGEPRLPAVRPHPAKPVSRPSRRVWIWAVGGLLAGVAGLALYFQPWASGPLAVAVETAALAPATRILAVNGRIAALHTVDVRALVGGTLADVAVAEGDSVEKGEALVQIDAAAQRAMVRQAVAGLDAALVAKAQASDNFARIEALGEIRHAFSAGDRLPAPFNRQSKKWRGPLRWSIRRRSSLKTSPSAHP